jgi:hypothetical protein
MVRVRRGPRAGPHLTDPPEATAFRPRGAAPPPAAGPVRSGTRRRSPDLLQMVVEVHDEVPCAAGAVVTAWQGAVRPAARKRGRLAVVGPGRAAAGAVRVQCPDPHVLAFRLAAHQPRTGALHPVRRPDTGRMRTTERTTQRTRKLSTSPGPLHATTTRVPLKFATISNWPPRAAM